jgi:hypothetical protein
MTVIFTADQLEFGAVLKVEVDHRRHQGRGSRSGYRRCDRSVSLIRRLWLSGCRSLVDFAHEF